MMIHQDVVAKMAQGQLLDCETVVAISEAISSEIDSERLIETLLKVALDHAGAQRGALFLHDGS